MKRRSSLKTHVSETHDSEQITLS
uniref:Uncharacterized protein n=1 Tax=Anguilla anguilla TaxID=7936 RepID=A0A0E9TFK7_ANGAN